MQRRSSVLAVVLGIALLAGLSARPAQASDLDKLMYVTFSGPVEIPGVGLPAGTYIFELANPDLGSRVVQVLSLDRKTVYSSFFTLPDSRLAPPNDTIVTFHEPPAGAPGAIKTWFYPGEATGFEFVYPKEQAMRIASATRSRSFDSKSSNADAQ
jgi:hypothetical protein